MKVARYILKPDHVSSANMTELLSMIVRRTQYQSGCIRSGIWSNLETGEVLLEEVWKSHEELQNHIISPVFKMILGAIELSTEKPEICFFDCENLQGLELIEDILLNKQD